MTMHPIQPIVEDSEGVKRFKENRIVRFLLDEGPFDLNFIGGLPFDQDDRDQFHQLIGYSLYGCPLSERSLEASRSRQPGESTAQVRARIAEQKLDDFREQMRTAIADLYDIHAEDLI